MEPIEPHNPKGINPAFMTYEEYYKLVNPDDKWHDNDSYDFGLANMTYHEIEKYPTIVRRLRVHNMDFTLRAQKEELSGYKWDEEKQTHLRDENNQLIPLTKDEIMARSGRLHEYSFAVFNEDEQAVAWVGDEWGAVLITVAREYRSFGFGPMLTKLYRTVYPAKGSGGFTPMGSANLKKVYASFVRDALQNGVYRQAIKDGKMTIERAKEIINSINVGRPKPRQNMNLNTGDPKNWLIFNYDLTSFIVYDKSAKELFLNQDLDTNFREHWYDRTIIGAVNVHFFDRSKEAILTYIGASDKRAYRFLIKAINSVCQAEGYTLYLDSDDVEQIKKAPGISFGNADKKTGYDRQPMKDSNPIPVQELKAMGDMETRWRKSFDKYDEFSNDMQDRAFSKWRNN